MSIRALKFSGAIDAETIRRFERAFDSAVADKCIAVHLVIDSKGGQLAPAITIHHYLRALPLAVFTYNLSSVSSSAVTIFAAGNRRFASTEATFLMHNVIPWYFPDGPQPTEEEQFLSARGELNAILALLSEQKINFTLDHLDRMKVADVTLCAQEALNCGLIHEVQSFLELDRLRAIGI